VWRKPSRQLHRPTYLKSGIRLQQWAAIQRCRCTIGDTPLLGQNIQQASVSSQGLMVNLDMFFTSLMA
jgi:hypothetical protein